MMTSSDNNKDKLCLLLKDNVGGSRVRSCAGSRIGLHDYRFCEHGVTQSFYL